MNYEYEYLNKDNAVIVVKNGNEFFQIYRAEKIKHPLSHMSWEDIQLEVFNQASWQLVHYGDIIQDIQCDVQHGWDEAYCFRVFSIERGNNDKYRIELEYTEMIE